jgi:arginine decarboxylase
LTKTPLTDAVRSYRESVVARLHVPAHGGGSGSPWLNPLFSSLATWDVTEQPELDDLSHPDGPIAHAQAAAAQLYGAAEAHYLTGGSTQGVHAAVLGSLLHGGALLAARDSHRSLLGAALLANADVVLASPERDPHFGVSLGLSAETVSQALAEHPDIRAVLVPYPTYLGIAPDLEAIARAARAHGALTIADSAHGAHFGWHPALPQAPIAAGADIVVAGMHKSGGSLTQTAILLLGEGALEIREDILLALRLIGTSSPSYVLMVSLEQSIAQAARDPAYLLDAAIAASQSIESEARVATGLPQDPLRVALQFDNPDMAHDFWDRLAQNGLRGEYFEEGLSLFIVPLGPPQHLDLLAQASRGLPRPRPADAGRALPITRITPARALRARRIRRRLHEAAGCTAADVVSVVPPGIPSLWPGERISNEAVESLQRALAQGRRVMGIDQQWLWVVSE